MSRIVHAGLIALHEHGRWTGVLIEGPSGVGKSDLALRCLTLGFRLVADDRVTLWSSAGRLWGSAPPAIAGLVEARGLGITPEAPRLFTEIGLVAHCLEPHQTVERMPETGTRNLEGVSVPAVSVRPLEASAPQKVLRALSLLGARR